MDLIEKGAKISLYLDTRRPKEDGIYPVKLRVYFGKARLFDTGKSLSQDDFDKSLDILDYVDPGNSENLNFRKALYSS